MCCHSVHGIVIHPGLGFPKKQVSKQDDRYWQWKFSYLKWGFKRFEDTSVRLKSTLRYNCMNNQCCKPTFSLLSARPRAPGVQMHPQMAVQSSMQMRPVMPRGPTRNISISPQATVHRPGEESYYGAGPQQRRFPDNIMQKRPGPPVYGM